LPLAVSTFHHLEASGLVDAMRRDLRFTLTHRRVDTPRIKFTLAPSDERNVCRIVRLFSDLSRSHA